MSDEEPRALRGEAPPRAEPESRERRGTGRPVSRVRTWVEAGLPWGILGLMAAGALSGQVSEGIHRLIQQNGAVLVLVAIVIQYAPRAIEAQRAQASAMSELSAAVRQVAQRDDYERRETLGVLSVLSEDMREVKRQVRTICRAPSAEP